MPYGGNPAGSFGLWQFRKIGDDRGGPVGKELALTIPIVDGINIDTESSRSQFPDQRLVGYGVGRMVGRGPDGMQIVDKSLG